MNGRLDQLEETISQADASRRELAEVLERFLADLEAGAPADSDALIAAHPEMADDLRPYLDSLLKLHAATQELRTVRAVGTGAADAFSAAKIGTGGTSGTREIGDYRIVREVGRGGMGVVYEAHQTSLNRRVALKILPFAAVLDQRQIARFRNEAQAAAQLHHPNIVPVFAVGQEHGVYYYAMQYIDGKSLEAAIEELRSTSGPPSARTTRAHGAANGSTTTLAINGGAVLSSERSIRSSEFFRSVARLGKEAAEALHHAHEYGIIHRDVKPSNLLLDLQGKLWVTDFGLARIQSDRGVTLTGDIVGTLRYMSPEQASGQAGLVDPRTDVYSLGTTLYELLTLQPAFPGDERQQVLRQVEQNEPLPVRRLNPSVPADLETIVLAAMSKPRDERYASAKAMADDLGRFLSGEPTLARRPGLTNRAAKWARRHRALVTVAACSVAVVSVVSSVGMVMLAREQGRTNVARQQAEENARSAAENFARAEQNFHQAQDVVDRFGVQLADQLVATPGTEPVRRQLLVDTLRYYRQFVAQAADDPKLQHELALAHFKSAVISAKLGDAAQAVAEYGEAQTLLAALLAADSGDSQFASELALAHNNRAILAAARNDLAEARTEYEEAIAMQRQLVAEHGDEPAFAAALAESQSNLGMLFDSLRDEAAAERSLAEAVDLLRPLVAGKGAEPRYARNLSIAANNLSYVLGKRDPAAGERASREAVDILERLAAEHPQSEQYQDDLALCYNNLAALLSRSGRAVDAIEWHARAVALQEQLVRRSPAVVRHRSDLAISLNNLGVAYCRAGRVDDADGPFARSRDLFATLSGDYPDELAYRGSLAALLNNEALALAGAGRHDRAVGIYPDAIAAQRDCWQRTPSPSPQSELIQQFLSKMVYNYGRSLQAIGKWDEAAAAALTRREIWQGNGERLFGVAVEISGIARAMAERSDGAAAENGSNDALAAAVVATLREAFESGYPRDANLADDERFAAVRENKQFAQLMAEVSQP